MASGNFCSFCGRYRGSRESPHPDHESCPFEDAHKEHNSNETLLEAIQTTRAGNSVCLKSWGTSYPIFKSVYKTGTWLNTVDTSKGSYEGHEKYDTSHFSKSIWATGNLYEFDTYYRIEYDPTTESLIDWYVITEGEEEHRDGSFDTYIRRDDPDVSFFGATLPG